MIARARPVLIAVAAAIGLSAAIYLVVRFAIVRVDSTAMEPVITRGSLVLVDRFAYSGASARRGDVVAYSGPVPFAAESVARVVAVPGDTYAIKGGRSFLNGQPQHEDLAYPPKYNLVIASYDIEVNATRLGESDVLGFSDWRSPNAVPPGCYLVLGDRRKDALDSHVVGFLCPGRPWIADIHEPTQLIGRVITRSVPTGQRRAK